MGCKIVAAHPGFSQPTAKGIICPFFCFLFCMEAFENNTRLSCSVLHPGFDLVGHHALLLQDLVGSQPLLRALDPGFQPLDGSLLRNRDLLLPGQSLSLICSAGNLPAGAFPLGACALRGRRCRRRRRMRGVSSPPRSFRPHRRNPRPRSSRRPRPYSLS